MLQVIKEAECHKVLGQLLTYSYTTNWIRVTFHECPFINNLRVVLEELITFGSSGRYEQLNSWCCTEETLMIISNEFDLFARRNNG